MMQKKIQPAEKNVIFAGSKHNEFTMKKLFLSLAALACLFFFNACSTKVDLYADYKDIPVIYGLLDANADTNYVKVVRAFSGSDESSVDATQVALIADSCNYPGKLDAKLYLYKWVFGNEYKLEDSIVLDTITIHDKDSGAFYYPNQKVYFTDRKVLTNNNTNKYKYLLQIIKGNDTIKSETSIVGGEDFKITNTQVGFVSEVTDKTGKIKFIPANNAAVYNMEVRFYYKEFRQGIMTQKVVQHSFGMKTTDEFENYANENGSFYVTYSQNLLFDMLNSAIGGDTLHVTRTFHPDNSFVISLAAGGDELFNYIQINQGAGGLSQNIPDYTNIKGGYGVFSSRVNLEKTVKISPRTQTDLIGVRQWAFSQEQ